MATPSCLATAAVSPTVWTNCYVLVDVSEEREIRQWERDEEVVAMKVVGVRN